MVNETIEEQIAIRLAFDMEREADRIAAWMRESLGSTLKKRGLVIAISGGIDSSVCAGLAVRAVGSKKVFGLLMPEKDSSSESVTRGKAVAEHCGIDYVIEDIAPTLQAIGCYARRDEAMSMAIPEYLPSWKSKIVISGGVDGRFNHFKLVVEDTEGCQQEKRLGLNEYLQIVAATNFKQRIRKTLEYFHADRLNYAVVGTPNRLEYDQGFFVKNGDGSADLKPIAHLYKSQVYMMARYIGLPEDICTARPSTDTYSLAQGQDEFYFALPYRQMDLALWAKNTNQTNGELAGMLGISEVQAQAIFQDIESKRRTTQYLHYKPLVLQDVFS
jgi:NAD+ synthase